MLTKTEVYIYSAIGALIGGSLFHLLNPDLFTNRYPEALAKMHPEIIPPKDEPYELSQVDVDDLEDQIEHLVDLVQTWERIAKQYPDEEEKANELIEATYKDIAGYRVAISAIKSVLAFRATQSKE